MSVAIKFENISKQYRLGLVSTNTISHDLNRWWQMNIRGKEDPYLKIGETNDRAHKGNSDYVWALKDINFEVEKGDVLGIIGKNGAGKSTLLKILSKVTAPSTGSIKAKGRIASLLEVGTGFHPELTGRENIYMNGAIMGMSKAEISSKLDEIVDFSGCERYIDTPVKRYSSGMMVRLGFAVAAHLDPEILVVDEVLAVGDAEFQKKAIGKMQDVSKGEGRTVLFVSHNMGAVRNLCKTGIVLENGSVGYAGEVNDSVDYYLNASNNIGDFLSRDLLSFERIHEDLSFDIKFINISFLENKNSFASRDIIEFMITIFSKMDIEDFRLNCTITDINDEPIGSVSGTEFYSISKNEEKTLKFSLINHNLAIGEYIISLSIGKGNFITGQKDFDIVSNVLKFHIDRFDSQDNIGFTQWHKTWGNIAFQSKLSMFK